MSRLLMTTLRPPAVELAVGSDRLASSPRKSGFESSRLKKSSISAASSGGLPSFRKRLDGPATGALLDEVNEAERPLSCWRIMVPRREERPAAYAPTAGLPAAPNESRLEGDRRLSDSEPGVAPVATPAGHSADPPDEPGRPYEREAVYDPWLPEAGPAPVVLV